MKSILNLIYLSLGLFVYNLHQVTEEIQKLLELINLKFQMKEKKSLRHDGINSKHNNHVIVQHVDF